MEQQL